MSGDGSQTIELAAVGIGVTMRHCQIEVRNLKIFAQIGVYAHEWGRRQPLIIDVLASVDLPCDDELAQTLDYVTMCSLAEDLAVQPMALIETFATRLALACLGQSGVNQVDVRVVKPEALANGTAAVRVSLGRSAAAAL